MNARYMNKRDKRNRKAINRNWSNQKANPALKTKTEKMNTSPSVTDVVQTLSWLFGSHDHPLTRQRIFTVNRYIKLNNYEEAKPMTEIDHKRFVLIFMRDNKNSRVFYHDKFVLLGA